MVQIITPSFIKLVLKLTKLQLSGNFPPPPYYLGKDINPGLIEPLNILSGWKLVDLP